MSKLKVTVKDGKITNGRNKVSELFSSLSDNDYMIEVRQINPLLTPRDCQDAYFGMVDVVMKETGNPRYTVHSEFKKHERVKTTTTMDLENWMEFLENFKWWAYNNFDIIV